MKFSIITITWNSSHYLAEAMESVLSQDGVDLEYIVMDGGSTDGTVDIIRYYAELDERIRWISEPDEGISDAFNKGIRLATGEIVGILNSDDRYADGALKAVADAFVANPECDVLHGDMIRFQGEKSLFKIIPSKVDDRVWYEMPLNHPSTFVTLSAYNRVGLFNKNLKIAMDYELVLRFYIAGLRFIYLPTVLSYMRYGGASDLSFIKARKEVFSVTTTLGYPLHYAFFWFLWKTAVGTIKNMMRTLGLNRLIKLHPRFRDEKNGAIN